MTPKKILIGNAGSALWYTDKSTKVPPSPARMTSMQAAKVVKLYMAAFATMTL